MTGSTTDIESPKIRSQSHGPVFRVRVGEDEAMVMRTHIDAGRAYFEVQEHLTGTLGAFDWGYGFVENGELYMRRPDHEASPDPPEPFVYGDPDHKGVVDECIHLCWYWMEAE